MSAAEDAQRTALSEALVAGDYTAAAEAQRVLGEMSRVPTGSVESQDLASDLVIDGGTL